jgi:hypothetical protein
MYEPTLGRWMEPDPIGNLHSAPDSSEPAAGKAEPQDHSLDSIGRARMGTAEKFGTAHKDDWWLWQYSDSSSLYEFLKSNPLNATDPTGTNRYVGSDFRVHYWLAVDDWAVKDGRWIKSGVFTYEFRLKYWCWYAPINVAGALTFSAQGEVERTPGMPGTPHYELQSSPKEDMVLKTELDAQVENPPNYQVFYFNSNYWVESYKYLGIPGQRQEPVTGWPFR